MIINSLTVCYIVFDTKNWNIKLDTLVYKLTSAKEITTYKPNGKTVFIKRADLNEWICRNRILSNYEIELEAELQAKRWETEHPNKFVNRKG